MDDSLGSPSKRTKIESPGSSFFEPNDSGSDFADELPILQESSSPTRRLDHEDHIQVADKREYLRPAAARKNRVLQIGQQYHKSLQDHINFQEKQTHVGKIPITKGLQECPNAPTGSFDAASHSFSSVSLTEALYRKIRPWHSSPVVPKSTKEHAIHKRPKPQECPHEGACKLLHDEDHLSKFTHECGAGFLCANVDPLHRLRFRHPSDNPNDPWEGKTGWKAENFRSPCCAPVIQEAKLQTGLPAISSCPRGGFRPQATGGTKYETEIQDFRKEKMLKKTNYVMDEIVLIAHNIDISWNDNDFQTYVRDLMGTRAIRSARVLRGTSEFLNDGRGLISCYNYADAHLVKKMLHNRPLNENVIRIEYNQKVVKPSDIFEKTLQDFRRRVFISESDPAVMRFNKMITKCGPYWQDAEGVLGRLKDEGYKPSSNTYIALIMCYRDARPPQPRKAQEILETMRKENIPLHTAACNFVVDCWCRAENMPRAESLVAKMERCAKAMTEWQKFALDESSIFPAPNEETYLILAEGWQRLGVMEDIARRQRGFRYDETKPKNHRDDAIGGVLGMSDPAPSILTSLARRRAGYSHINAGLQTQETNPDNFSALECAKWRSRV